MQSTWRAGIVALGGTAAILSYCVVPGLYAVRYSPPPGTPHANVTLNRLHGFPTLGNGHLVLYRHDTAPGSFLLTLVAIIVIAAAGLGIAAIEGLSESRFASRIDHRWRTRLLWAGAAGLGVVALQFLWAFLGGVSASISSAFVADLGGGADAVAAARYLSPVPGFGAVVLVLGVVIMVTGCYPRIGIAAIVLTIVGSLLLALGWRGTIATVGPVLTILFLLYMFFFRISVVLSVIGLIFSTFVLFWGLSVTWQGAGHRVPLFEGGRALILRTTDGQDVDGKIYIAIGIAGSALGLYLVSRSIRSIIRAWRKGPETAHLEDEIEVSYIQGRPDLGSYPAGPPDG